MKINIISLCVILFFFTSNAYCQSNTSTSSAHTTTQLNQQIQNLKDKIATKVAELVKTSSQVLYGECTDVSENTLTITSKEKNTTISFEKDLTQIIQTTASGSKKITSNVIQKGDMIVAFGFILDSEFSARTIYASKPVVLISGQITEIIKDTYTVNLISTDKKQYSADIETSTKQEMVNTKTLMIEKGGFSKMSVNDYIHIVGSFKNGNSIQAIKTLVIPSDSLK